MRDTFTDMETAEREDLAEYLQDEIKHLEKAGAFFLGLYKGSLAFSARTQATEKELKSWSYKKKIRKIDGKSAGSFWTSN